jgi:hypothetical protein
MPDLSFGFGLVEEPQEQTELYLALQGPGFVCCRRCRRQVDLGKSCELARASDGRVTVTACHTCLVEPPHVVQAFVRELVDQVGGDVVVAALTDLACVPPFGSVWIWRSLVTSDVRSVTFDRMYADGRNLRFVGADGNVWACPLRDWRTYLGNGQAEPRR